MLVVDRMKSLLTPAVVADDNEPQSPNSSEMPSLHLKRHRIWPLITLLILVHLSAVLCALPLNRVIESRLCLEHYKLHNPASVPPDGSIPENLCKIDEVQKWLAWLQGIVETTLVVCGMCAVPPRIRRRIDVVYQISL
jgi:hypothetical protein